MESLRLVPTSYFQDPQLFEMVRDCDKYNYYVSLQLIEMKRNDNMETCIFLNVSTIIFIAFAMGMGIFVNTKEEGDGQSPYTTQ